MKAMADAQSGRLAENTGDTAEIEMIERTEE